ncbi:hypothetical protein ACCC92_06740 [Mucilaginibacter sp. Mucisp84]|uniref:hypothetical protein n=1 Tax=Mucilaginibacter sp. Mucisp84 TaxID=3243058 RepID=UPI0039A6F162
MFRLFNRKKSKRPVQDWELVLMYKTLEKLPTEFEYLKRQIEADIFASSLVGYSASYPDYVAFSYSDEYKEFRRMGERDYEITNIKVRDIDGENWFDYTIFVSEEVISGYSVKGLAGNVVDIISADVSSCIIRYETDDYRRDYQSLKDVLSNDDLKLIDPDEIYEVNLKERVFYHIYDLEDGDFIGIESNGQICKITHDPFEITPLKESLSEIFSILKAI